MEKINQQLQAEFLEHLASINFSDKTIRIRRQSIDSFLKAFPVKPFTDVTEEDISSYAKSLECHKENTQSIRMRSLKLFFTWLEENFHIFHNPMKEVSIKPVSKLIPRTLSVKQIDTVLESIDISKDKGIRNRAFLELAYSTAARRSELLNLKLEDIDLVNCLLLVDGKGSKERRVPFGSLALEWLNKYLEHRKAMEIAEESRHDLWINRYGVKISEQVIETLFRNIRKNTGIDCSCHTLRRSCATHLLQNDMPPSMICDLLGHASLASLKHYLKVDIEELKESQSLMEGPLWNVP